MTRILLGQLGSNGDCLYATTIARQIKHDFPDCHLTWAISSLCKKVIDNNPHVDSVWEIEVNSWADLNTAWQALEVEAARELARGRFDHTFLTQICPSHFGNYDGTIRPSLFRNYPRPITVPVETVINLTEIEKQRVAQWADDKGLSNFEKVVIFECSSKSGQSFVTPKLAAEVAGLVAQIKPNVAFVLSTHEKLASNLPQVIHGGALSMRETAALTHYADLFVGCGSGLTVVATSAAAKPDLPNIQILKQSTSVYASFKHDFEYFGKSTEHFLETTHSNPERLAATILAALDEGIVSARAKYGEDLPLNFHWYFELIDQMLLQSRQFVEASNSITVTMERYGRHPDLMRFAKALICPFVELDPAARYPRGREIIERLNAVLASDNALRSREKIPA